MPKKEKSDAWLYEQLIVKNDGRQKLLKCQEERIIAIRKEGVPYRGISDVFFMGNISVCRVYHVVNPDKYKQNNILSSAIQAKKKYKTDEQIREDNKNSKAKRKVQQDIEQGRLKLI